MSTWFEYGYYGFPPGEKRRRFYRQRDDPCGSEDECDFDDETSDRPIYYYPLPTSKGGSSTSQDDKADLYCESDSEGGGGRAQEKKSLPFFIHSTAYTDIPARYGSSVVTFTSDSPCCRCRQYVLWHGGAAVATHRVGCQFHLAELRPSSGITHAIGASYSSAVDCVFLPEDPSLAEFINWPLSHPAIRAITANERVLRDEYRLPRFGHNAVHIDIPYALQVSLLCRVESPPPVVVTSDHVHQVGMQGYLIKGLANAEHYELHLSLVIGGAASAPGLGSGGAITALGNRRYTAISKPALCLTLIRHHTEHSHGAHWTTYCAFGQHAGLTVSPRIFATLTPWQSSASISGSATFSRSFVYLGGTENGWQPISSFALTIIRLDLRTWQWSTAVECTLGAEPASRFGHTTTHHNEQMFVFGGVGHGRSYLNDLHILDMTTKVWREVFVPLSQGLPPRAFHSAAIIVRDERDARASGGSNVISAFNVFSFDEQGGDKPISVSWGKHTDEEVMIADTVTGTKSGSEAGGLLIVGGERVEGLSEGSAWLLSLHKYTWVEVCFPLQEEVSSFHVAAPSMGFQQDDGNVLFTVSTLKNTMPVAPLTLNHLRRIVLSLREKNLVEKCSFLQHPQESPTLRAANNFEPFVFSTCHGSLFQLVPLFSINEGRTVGVMIFGGTQSPPILLVTHVLSPSCSLKERVAFWMFRDTNNSTCRLLLDTIIRRSPYLFKKIFAGTQFYHLVNSSRVLSSAFYTTRKFSFTNALTSDLVEEADRLANASSLVETLDTWMRAARKRLKEEALS